MILRSLNIWRGWVRKIYQK